MEYFYWISFLIRGIIIEINVRVFNKPFTVNKVSNQELIKIAGWNWRTMKRL